MSPDNEKIDWARVVLIIFSGSISISIGLKFGYSLNNNPDAINTIVTIFSILAGFLIALITFIIEPALSNAKDWISLQKQKKTIRRQLFRQKVLFYLYLMTLGIALTMYLIPKDMKDEIYILQICFLSLACFVFLASFSLPESIMRIQMERYEAALRDQTPPALTKAAQGDASKN